MGFGDLGGFGKILGPRLSGPGLYGKAATALFVLTGQVARPPVRREASIIKIASVRKLRKRSFIRKLMF